jgi:hypothetical protein
MQVLCIQSLSYPGYRIHVKKGEIYHPTFTGPQGVLWGGLDMWHRLEEFNPTDYAHVSLFIDLPSQEGVVFSKKVEEPVMAPFHS